MSGSESKDLSASNSSTDISHLQENFSKQQKKITALKELVTQNKSTSSAQEKVKNIAQRLTLLKSKARNRSGANVAQQNEQSSTSTALPSEQVEDMTAQTHTSLGRLPWQATPNPMPNRQPPLGETNTPPAAPPNTIVYSSDDDNGNTSVGAGSEKILLLRQQMEQNRVLMAQRASSKQHLEQLVTQMREQFDSTQQCLEDTNELGKSMTNLSAFTSYTPVIASRDRHRSATDLTTQTFSLERERIKFLENRCRLLEKQLEKEKHANRMQTETDDNKVLISQAQEENARRLANENERLLKEIALKEGEIGRLRVAQPSEGTVGSENVEVLAAEAKLAEIEQLRKEIEQKIQRIKDLESVNDALETARSDLTARSSDVEERLLQLEEELNTSHSRLEQAREQIRQTESKCSMLQESLVKLQLLPAAIADSEHTDNQIQAEMAKQIQQLQDEVAKLQAENVQLHENISKQDKLAVSDASIAEKIASLEATIQSQSEELQQRTEVVQKLEEQLMEKTIEFNVLNANFKVLEQKLVAASAKSKPLFATGGMNSRTSTLLLDAGDADQDKDIRNLKFNQMENQHAHSEEITILREQILKFKLCNEELQQKISELEAERDKWQWQGDWVEVDETSPSMGSAATAATVSELKAQLQTQTDTVRLLQEQRYEQTEEFKTVQSELETLREKLQQHEDNSETARVQSQMSEIHLEEKVEEQAQEIDLLQERLTAKVAELQQLQQRMEEVQGQKQAVDKKLEHYINENIELLDKMEKLSKSSSSAESIEIVERLTQQERAEIDVFNKRLEEHSVADAVTASAAAVAGSGSHVSEVTQTDMGPELSENLTKLREESSELMNKIELFTTERREVLEKMEHLTNENHDLQRRIVELSEEREQLESSALLTENAKSKLEAQLHELCKEKDLLASQVAESTAQKAQLSQDLSTLQKSSEVVAALDLREGTTLFDKCEQSLSKLNSELEAYRKANDKNSKINASKKLAKEAKNAHTQLSELLQKVKEASTAVETVTVVETVVAVTAPNGKALAEYEQLTAQNRELKTTVSDLRRELQQMRDQEPSTVEITELHGDEVPAIVRTSNESEELNAANAKLQQALADIQQYETQMAELQSTVEDVRVRLREAMQADDEKSTEIAQQREQLEKLRKTVEDFDRQLNDKEMTYEKQLEQLTRQRKQLEGKCDTYEGEMEILQTLVSEQKQQLIEAYKESEHELNMKMLDLQNRDELIAQLRDEIVQIKSSVAGNKMVDGVALQQECEKLRDSLRINKMLVTEQVDELANKQETIDTLNQQIMDLYKTMEDNANKVIEREDELAEMEERLNANQRELDAARKDNNEQKSVVDKLLSELHSHREHNTVYVTQLQSDLQRLQASQQQLEGTNRELEQRSKDQLEKLKKYAANLKKRAAQCVEFEAKVKELEKGALESMQSKEGAEEELLALRTNNAQLTETVARLERQRDENESALAELQRALQTQTVEVLEASERASKLETELSECRSALKQKQQEIEQLQNALAASQEHDRSETSKRDVWGADVRSADAEDLAEERTKCERLNTELSEKTSLLRKLHDDLHHAEDNLAMKVREIEVVRAELMATQEQASDWGANAFPKIDTDDTTDQVNQQLQAIEQQLNDVQNELLVAREQQRSLQQTNDELTATVLKRDECVSELQAQLEQQRDGRIAELQSQLEAQQKLLQESGEELKARALKFEKSKAVIKERNNQIHRLQAQLKNLQDKLSTQPEEEVLVERVSAPALQAVAPSTPSNSVSTEEHNALQQTHKQMQADFAAEREKFQTTLSRLETLHDGIKAKLQENLSYIESLELENGKYKDKISRLEECVATFEERRASMERRAHLLDEQLQTRTDEYERSEDALVYRLNMLSEHDDVIGKRLLESQEEKEELQERLDRVQSEHKSLSSRHTALEKEFQAYRSDASANWDDERRTLREQLQNAEDELQRSRSTFDARLAAKATEIDELECELTEQLDAMNAEKRALLEEAERSFDECTELKDELVKLRESLNGAELDKQELERELTWRRLQQDAAHQNQCELEELRIQTLQDKTEMANLHFEIESLTNNHQVELQALRNQIAELDTLRVQVGQNQTDDQVFLETENKRLTDLLAEKEALIENYQLRIRQRRMAPRPPAPRTPTDPFGLGIECPGDTLWEEREQHERELRSLRDEVLMLSEINQELQAEVMDQNLELEELRGGASQDEPSSQGERSSQGEPPSQMAYDGLVPPPPAFFATDQLRSPFDEIIESRSAESFESAIPSRSQQQLGTSPLPHEEQRTIEDLQRNVSDLEKYAEELKNKLAARNSREAVLEEQKIKLEACCHEREQRLQVMQVELQQLQQRDSKNSTIKVDELAHVEGSLIRREAELRKLQLYYQERMLETTKSLEKREHEIDELRYELAAAKRPPTSVIDLESQIVPDAAAGTIQLGVAAVDAPVATVQFQPTLDMFFGTTDAGAGAATEFERLIMPSQNTLAAADAPVVEETIVPKKAYLCQPEGGEAPTTAEAPSLISNAFDIDSDWGDSWGGHEGAAEEAHFTKTAGATATAAKPQSLVPAEQRLEIALQEERERVEELRLALERSEQQRQELQIKSGKMVKKLKEYKVKLEEQQLQQQQQPAVRKSASVESNSMFADLDAAIQDELKAQIARLEARLAEQHKAQEQLTLEREKLLKRVDVLTAGNDRMSEMKERQDMDVQMYQARIRELQGKLQSLDDWGTADEAQSQNPEPSTAATSASEPLLHSQPQPDVAALESKLSELTAELADANCERQELQALLEEERANVARVEQTVLSLKQSVAFVDEAAAESQSADHNKYEDLHRKYIELHESHGALTDELQATAKQVEQLQSENKRLQETLASVSKAQSEGEAQLLELRARLAELSQANDEWQQVSEECVRLKKRNEELEVQEQQQPRSSGVSSQEDLAALLLERESEILHLKQRVEDLMREDQTEKLVLEILAKNQEIHMLRMQTKRLEDDKAEMEHNLTLQITKEMQAATQVTADTDAEQKLQQQNDALEAQVRELQAERASMEEELKVLNAHVLDTLQQEEKMKTSVLELDAKNIEIAELRNSLESLKAAVNEPVAVTAATSPQVDMTTLNAQWEALVEQRCGEIAEMWRQHLEQREREFETHIAALSARNNEGSGNSTVATQVPPQPPPPLLKGISADTTTSTPASASTSPSASSSAAVSKDGTPLHYIRNTAPAGTEDDERDVIEKMQTALESQEIEIVSLKEQLAIRSAEYARLAAQYDPFKLQTTTSHRSMLSTAGPMSLDSSQSRRNPSPADGSTVPKSELDLALYMLHQRDMRCEEVTVELVSLLAERDTLQLKLSNTLRQLETVKSQTTHTDTPTSSNQSDAQPVNAMGESPVKPGTSTSTITSESDDELTQKLSQLQTVNHSKDKVIKEERDQRIRQMEKIQQDMAKIPPAAVSELVGSDLSQTSQSPSSTLLNWLWGHQPTNPSATSGGSGGAPAN